MTVATLKELARTQRQHGDLAAAAQTLQSAIADSRDSAELADLYGMLGGTRREQGNLIAAAQAYDAGFQLESEVDSSYNALNRLVTRVALEPASLSDANALRKYAKLEFVDVRRGLAELQVQLRRDVDGRRADDVWAAGDLALTAALSGDVGETIEALSRFARRSPTPGARAKYHQTFAELAQLDTPSKEALTTAKDWLEKQIG